MEMATDTMNNQTDTGTTNRTREADMKHRLENGLLPGLPARHIHKRLNSAPGDEIGSGKFTHPESSAALVANAFGPFMTDSPAMELPALPIGPIDKEFDWSASSVEVEVECKFPWDGGMHPWLDIRIDQPGTVIGIESKRYEPFRDTSVARFSDAYWRDVWGERMGGYCALRDKMKEGQIEFRHLNAAQLVKHAFGLRTVAHSRPGLVRRRAIRACACLSLCRTEIMAGRAPHTRCGQEKTSGRDGRIRQNGRRRRGEILHAFLSRAA